MAEVLSGSQAAAVAAAPFSILPSRRRCKQSVTLQTRRFPDETLTPSPPSLFRRGWGRRRFPGKIMQPLGDHTVLEEVLGRCARISGADLVGLCRAGRAAKRRAGTAGARFWS